MSKFWSDITRRLTPYIPGEQPKIDGLIKLNTNENPYGPSPKALAAISAEAGDALRLYPDPDSSRLKHAIARHYGVTEAEVFVGNGSDEVLAHTFLALLRHDRPLLVPDISYSFYPVYCGLYDIAFETVPLDAGFRIWIDDYLDRPAGAILIANPNAPTAQALPAAEIERLVVARPDTVVVIDEAYIDFGGESVIPLTRRHPNLLVIHTLSKSHALAGLRVGFAIGHADLVTGLERVKNSFNSYPLDRMAIAGAAAAIEDVVWFEETRQRVIASRTRLIAELRALGFEVLPSAANFVFARHPRQDGAQLAQALRERAILIRHFKQPRIDQFLRISIGTDAQCTALVAALRDILGA